MHLFSPAFSQRHRLPLLMGTIVLVSLAASGCESVYYNAMEKIGFHKRDLMVRHVEQARDAQQEAKEQFTSALDRFTTVLNVKGGDLQEKYETLHAEYEQSVAKANAVRDRIESVEEVSEALFEEWEDELEEYSSTSLRRSSKKQLAQTRTRYAQLIKTMNRAEASMDPVLTRFKDQVLFLKHNLNAQAIASLKNELNTVESNVAALIKEINASIKEADAFIATMANESS
jgi:hypothetical protein